MDHITQQNIHLAANILGAGKDMVLASIRPDGTPHASTISYASVDLRSYCAISLDSQKAHNIRHQANVAYVVNTAYSSWAEILGVSINAQAIMLVEPRELRLASTLLLQKYPEFSALISEPSVLPWPGMLFIALQPLNVALLDYSKGFGHTDYFSVAAPPGPRPNDESPADSTRTNSSPPTSPTSWP